MVDAYRIAFGAGNTNSGGANQLFFNADVGGKGTAGSMDSSLRSPMT
jgi:hypothetical protein